MPLLIHDGKGEITQVIIQAEVTLEVLKKRHDKLGIPAMLGAGDPAAAYVVNGTLVPRPELTIAGELRAVKADGVDTLELSIAPGTFNIVVLFGAVIVHQETVSDGALAFSADHAGSYVVHVAPPFPYRAAALTIEAVA
jgi:hypothetical protein